MKGVTHAKTKKILQAFETIAAVPRCSKHEEKICDFLLHWAKENGLPAKKDKVGNIAIQVPASRGYEKSTGVVIQGHVDMVCEKTPDSRHDFVRDAIELVYDKGWLMANKTTLGADNGIALAMALTLALDKEAKHPPLELLFTVDEETGLTGANSIEPGFIRGKILLNVDSEDEGVFTVGCAGGRDTHITLPVEYAPALPGAEACQVKASGMSGGHSGVNIHDERANAIIVLARTLHQIHRRTPLQLLRITGGTAHNAIPRDAEAIFFLAKEQVGAVRQQVSELEKTFQNEFKNTDPNLKLTFSGAGTPSAQPLAAASSARCINLLLALPHGVAAMSTEMKSLVETSNNLANVKIEDGKVAIVTSQRMLGDVQAARAHAQNRNHSRPGRRRGAQQRRLPLLATQSALGAACPVQEGLQAAVQEGAARRIDPRRPGVRHHRRQESRHGHDLLRPDHQEPPFPGRTHSHCLDRQGLGFPGRLAGLAQIAAARSIDKSPNSARIAP